METIFPQEADTVQHKETTFTMPVNKPCFALGYKEAAINRGDTRMEVIADLLPDLICGGLTDLSASCMMNRWSTRSSAAIIFPPREPASSLYR